MKCFLEFVQPAAGTYVCAKLDQGSAEALERWVGGQLNERVKEAADYHTTVIYSPTRVDEAYALDGQEINWDATPVCLSNFGDHLVLELECEMAQDLNSSLVSQGATSTFEEYKPHITLISHLQDHIDAGGSVPDSIEGLPPLHFDRLSAEDLKPEPN